MLLSAKDSALRVCADQVSTNFIYIFGAPRSGTTWLGKLFDSNPDTYYFHEPLSKVRSALLQNVAIAARRGDLHSPVSTAEVIADLLERNDNSLILPFFDKRFDSTPARLKTLSWYGRRVFPGWLFSRSSTLDRRFIRSVVFKDGLTYFSLRLSSLLGGRSIVIIRHPCGAINSYLRGQKCGAFNLGSRKVSDAECQGVMRRLGLSENDLKELTTEEFLAVKWLGNHSPIMQLSESERKNIQIVRYEDLVARPRQVVSELFHWAGIQLTNQTVDFIAASSQTKRHWVRSLLGERFSYYSINRRTSEPHTIWRQELSEASQARIMRIVSRFPIADYYLTNRETSRSLCLSQTDFESPLMNHHAAAEAKVG